MVNQITAKKCETISHIEVPTELLQGLKRNNSSNKDGYKQGPQAKKGNKKTRVMHPWNTELKDMLWRIPHCITSVIIGNVPRKLLSLILSQRTVDSYQSWDGAYLENLVNSIIINPLRSKWHVSGRSLKDSFMRLWESQVRRISPHPSKVSNYHMDTHWYRKSKSELWEHTKTEKNNNIGRW